MPQRTQNLINSLKRMESNTQFVHVESVTIHKISLQRDKL